MPAPSPYPASFDGNSWLFASALASLMCIAIFGLSIMAWMARDIWRDRFIHHPTCLLFGFRLMMLFAGMAAFARCLPEVLYMTCYGEPAVPAETISLILMVKRALDVMALPLVVAWMAMLVLIYPFVVIALRTGPASAVKIDPLAFWPRLVRPIIILSTVVAISLLMAIAKGAGMGG